MSFKNDYSEGAHPRILQALADTNLEKTDGYGVDPHCARAADMLRERVGCPEAEVVFVTGGTQANLIMLAHALRPYQAVISASSGHIVHNETGAIEAAGHKIITMPVKDGKLTVGHIQAAMDEYNHPPHMVQSKVVYISQSTETGTLYSRAELEAIHRLCKDKGLYLYIDGARLSNALAAQKGELELPDYARLADAFTLGGTKNGALLGEALIIVQPALKEDIRFSVKQRGGLIAKGRILGIQFEALLRDDLYLELASHANAMAVRLRDGLKDAGIRILYDSPTNLQFAVLPDKVIAALDSYDLYILDRFDPSSTAVRFAGSWATREEEIDAFIAALRAAGGK